MSLLHCVVTQHLPQEYKMKTLLFIALLLVSNIASAQFTQAQLNIIKADMLTHAELDAARLAGDDTTLAAYYNTIASPAFTVWRTNVSLDEIQANSAFDWALVDNLTVGKGRIWEWMFNNQATSINPSKSNVQAGISACWVGSAPLVAVRDAILLQCKRSATRLEKLFATGTGTVASPAIMVVEGDISPAEISGAR